ncbi:MAG: valine--pyruvate transaminase [Planctomycetaceae bacterium]|nr:valine--pyruvate transaminase [Planctomycetaceae bacterium]
MPGQESFYLSTVGEKLTARSGILELMDDLGRAMTIEPDMLMLGGGNPAAVPAMQQLLRERMQELLNDADSFDRMLGNYDPPQGSPAFRVALAELLQKTYGWSVGPENIAITSGGQTAFFYLFNMLAGAGKDGKQRKILLPLCPEYIGYADQGLEQDLFVACRPDIVWPEGEEQRIFKYRINFDAVRVALAEHDVAAIAVSRPTNPTGNVLTDDEVRELSALARVHEIPLILDNAYGVPFPGVVFVDAVPHWDPHVILTMSLSKLGLPGTRTGIVVAPEPIATAMGAMTAITGLANGNVGQQMVLPWVRSGRILELGPELLLPFYQEKSRQAASWTREFFDAAGVDWALHVSEGAFFHWLWLRNLSISTKEFYQRLKSRKVLVVPGEYFFFGLAEEWEHSAQCLRLNFSQPADRVRSALQIIAEEAARAARK